MFFVKFENFEKFVWLMFLYYIVSRYLRLNGCVKVLKILIFVNRFLWNSIKKLIIYNILGMLFFLYIVNNYNISLVFLLIYFFDMKFVWLGLIIILSIFLILWVWMLFICIMMLIKNFFLCFMLNKMLFCLIFFMLVLEIYLFFSFCLVYLLKLNVN